MNFKFMSFVIAAGLLLLVATNVAHASIMHGETFDLAFTAIQTSPPVAGTVTFGGSFTIGSLVPPSTTDWSITAFSLTGCNLGIQSCSSVVWTGTLEFDASNETLFGSVSAPFTGNGGDSRLFTITYVDGNTSTNPYTNADLTDSTNSRAGTFSYSISSVPEPSPAVLLALGLALVGVAGWRLRTRSSNRQ